VLRGSASIDYTRRLSARPWVPEMAALRARLAHVASNLRRMARCTGPVSGATGGKPCAKRRAKA
jgi:hypothetical protein